MRLFTPRPTLAVALAVLLSLGLGFMPVRAAVMAAKMTAALNVDVALGGWCDECAGKVGTAGHATGCAFSCTVAAIALPAAVATIAAPPRMQRPVPLEVAAVRGRALPPDPDPPRPASET